MFLIILVNTFERYLCLSVYKNDIGALTRKSVRQFSRLAMLVEIDNHYVLCLEICV